MERKFQPRGLPGTAAHTAAVLCAAATILAVALTLATPAGNRALDAGPTPAVGLLGAAVGALIVARQPRNLVAWLLVASGVASAGYALATAATALGLVSSPGAGWLEWGGWVSTVGWLPGTMLGLVLLPQLFPDGELLPGRFWRVWWWGSVGLAVAVFVSLALTPAAPLFPGLANPLLRPENGVAGNAVEALAGVWGAGLTILFAALSVGSVVNIVQRFRGTTRPERRKTALVLGAWLVLIVASAFGIGRVGFAAAILYLLSILLSVAKYRLYEIDGLLSRSAAGLAVIVVLGAAYALTVSAIGALLPGPWPAGFAATAVVVLLLDPVRRVSLRWINRIFSRGRPDAAGLGSRISAVAATAATPRAALEQTVSLLREELHIPALEVTAGTGTGAGAATAAAPPPNTPTGSLADSLQISLPLHWNGQPVGTVTAAPRRGDFRVDSADLRLLAALEPALGLVVHDLLITADLEASRRALLGAREEERRRIRRDLHDGLGPLLAGTAMTLRAAESPDRGAVDSPRTRALLAQARADLTQAVGDIRVLVDGLRPPILDDLGLVAAVQAILPESGPAVTVTEHGDCAKLPAVVEVAALRIVAEALANVARHANASRVLVALHRSDGELLLSVADNGTWVPPSSARTGMGLESMRQRARELGGDAGIGPGQDCGTEVRAWLPVAMDAVPEPAPGHTPEPSPEPVREAP